MFKAVSREIAIYQILEILETQFLRRIFKNVLHKFYLIIDKEKSTELLPERLYLMIDKRQFDLSPFLIVQYSLAADELHLALKLWGGLCNFHDVSGQFMKFDLFLDHFGSLVDF